MGLEFLSNINLQKMLAQPPHQNIPGDRLAALLALRAAVLGTHAAQLSMLMRWCDELRRIPEAVVVDWGKSGYSAGGMK